MAGTAWIAGGAGAASLACLVASFAALADTAPVASRNGVGASTNAPAPGVVASPTSAGAASRAPPIVASPAPPKHLDRSGKPRIGKASYYARSFAGRKMADGNRMDPQGNNAASKTLPLGTVAKVTNLDTGQSAVVKIQDRGPYVDGRIVDLSPQTAREVGIGPKEGVAPVKVEPLLLPAPDKVADARERAAAR